MKRTLNGLLILLTFPLLVFAGTSPEVSLTSWVSSEGMKRFESAKIKRDFFPLAQQFESQTNRIFCGPTTAAIILNALRGEALRSERLRVNPDESLLATEDRTYLNPERTYVFNRYTANNVFDLSYRKKAAPKTKLQVLGEPMGEDSSADWGFQLHQLHELFEAHGLKSELRPVHDKLPLRAIRAEIKKALEEENKYVVVNYARGALSQPGFGHISPVAAFDAKSDSFLLMDVNPNAADWVWVKSTDLTEAMRTFDTIQNRGYLIVSEDSWN